jgi:hypothetical protein
MANDPKVSWDEVNVSAIQVDANTTAWHTKILGQSLHCEAASNCG